MSSEQWVKVILYDMQKSNNIEDIGKLHYLSPSGDEITYIRHDGEVRNIKKYKTFRQIMQNAPLFSLVNVQFIPNPNDTVKL